MRIGPNRFGGFVIVVLVEIGDYRLVDRCSSFALIAIPPMMFVYRKRRRAFPKTVDPHGDNTCHLGNGVDR